MGKAIKIDDLKKLIAKAVLNGDIQQHLDCDCKTAHVDFEGNRRFDGVAILTTKSKDFEIKAYNWFSCWENKPESFGWDPSYLCKNARANFINMQVTDYLDRPLNGYEIFCELPHITTDIDHHQVLLDLVTPLKGY